MADWQEQFNLYFSKWNEGFKTFDAAPIKMFYHEDFVGYWGNSKLTIPDQYDRNYNVEEVLQGMPGAIKTFTTLHSSHRAEDEVSVLGILTASYEGQEYPSHCLYILRKTNNHWKILREYIEIDR